MQIKHSATVHTAGGEDVGRIDRVVLDPRTKDVTHVVVRKGFLFTEDKVAPIDLIESATEDGVTLREDAGDLHALPPFEEIHYLRLSDEEWRDSPYSYQAGYALPLYWYPPAAGFGIPYGPADSHRLVTRKERNIPEGAVALKPGVKVTTADGKEAGTIEEVFTGPQADRLTGFVISQGLLFKDKKRVPANWISRLGEDEVQLAVVSRTLERLRAYEG